MILPRRKKTKKDKKKNNLLAMKKPYLDTPSTNPAINAVKKQLMIGNEIPHTHGGDRYNTKFKKIR